MSWLSNHLYRFADFTIDSSQRVLLRSGKPVALTPKAFDTLLILVESVGRIVEKEELKKKLWPDTFVAEANIAFNIQQLRKALGDDARNPRYIETVARRGYRFMAEVEVVSLEREPSNVGQPDNEGSEKLLPDAQIPAIVQKRGFDIILPFAVGTVILLAGAGLLIWKVSKSSTSTAGVATSTAAATSRLKLEQLTATGQSYHVAISPDGQYVAYERVLENKGAIWLRQLGANTNVELVPPTGRIFGLSFNTAGDYLYFVRGDPIALYRVSLVGGPPTKIADGTEGAFSISRNGDQIVFIRQRVNLEGQREYALLTAKADGQNERELMKSVHPFGLDTPVWTPDGRTILCAYGNTTGGSQEVSLIEVSASDGQKQDLASEKFFRITKMAWLANGAGLLLSARKNLGENNQLWRLSYPGMQLTQLTEGLISYADLSLTSDAQKGVASQETITSDLWVGASAEPRALNKITQATGNFCWAPDGQLVYSSTASGNRDLWIMQRDGSDQRQLTVDPAMDVSPRVTPDNRYIVFISNRTGAFQVWRMNIDGSNQIQLTNGGPKNYLSISADSKWVLYNTTDDWHMWRVSIEGGEEVELTKYYASWPSMSPDQKTIVAVGRTGSQREFLVLPVSGGEPLQRIKIPGNDISGYRIKWTPDGKSLIYMSYRDGPIAIVKQSLDGRSQDVAVFDEDELFDFDFSSDGQFLAVTRGGWYHDVVLISDLGS
jgi:Tol biopolymer transport system component/DNA-binding winged helix-turn-helix (wHTH) protein